MATESANNTIVTSTISQITDFNGDVWTLVASSDRGNQISINGQIDDATANVVELRYIDQTIYQTNTEGGWWSKSGKNSAWMDSSEPILTPSVRPSPTRRVVSPLSGTVTKGTWISKDINFPGVKLTSGKPFHFIVLLPAQYSPEYYYPVMMWLHPNWAGTGWYNGSDKNPLSVALQEADGMYNTIDFRTNHPCIILVPCADQTHGNDAIANWGGWTNDGSVGSGTHFSGDTGPNTFGAIGSLKWVLENLSGDPSRVYIAGFSLGGIGSQYLMLYYNQVNGREKLFTAATSNAGVLAINNYNGPTSSDVERMRDVPVWWVSGTGDGESPASKWNSPMWEALAGNKNYPAAGSNAEQSRAGSSQYHYWLANIGHQDRDSSGRPFPTNKIILDWMFSQIGDVPISIKPDVPPPVTPPVVVQPPNNPSKDKILSQLAAINSSLRTTQESLSNVQRNISAVSLLNEMDELSGLLNQMKDNSVLLQDSLSALKI